MSIDQLEFIQLAIKRAGNEEFPDTGLFTQAHRMASAIPVVKLPHHRDPAGVWRPDRKARTGDAIHGVGVRAQSFVRAQVRPLGQQPGVNVLQQRAETVRVVNQVLLSVPGDGQLVAKSVFTPRQQAAKESARVEAFEFADFTPGFRFNNPHFGGIW